MMNVLQVYRSPDGQWDFDDSNNAVLFYDQPNVEPLFRWGSSEIDIPPNQIALDVKLYEVDTQNSLELGFDFQSWKNGPGRSLFEYIVWDFNGDDPMNLFPGNVIGNVADWGNYHAYNFTISTAYVDFLQTKGKARLLTESTISAKSGTVAELAAVDQIATFQTAYTTPPANRNLVDPLRLSQIYEYYESQGRVRVPIENFENMAVAAVINEIRWFCQNVLGIFSNATLQQIENELLDQGADGSIDVDEMYSITVPMSITLQVFHDRTLTYLKQECKTGVLLSILPVVGIESAELAIALDVSDVNGYTDVGAPIIEHRYFSSAVEVKNGQPFVLAGIKRSADVSMASGIPYLRDIPWLGYAFGKETTKKVEKDLVVFLVPRFQLCQTSDTQPAEEVKTAIALAKGEAVLEVPETSFGFDQWILDPAK
ncbi:MAG: outer membrane porin HofQ [candidate division BRC1 bacterium ADurb.BinA364]|nr:MAG: outer membrane porin HofQ [candidate division BRC1 bacterium ADurb.BinA364]